MDINGKKVDALKKVTLSVSAPGPSDGSESGAPGKHVGFIFGVGSQGLSPFEYELAGRRPGDAITVSVAREKFSEMFAHLQPLFCGMTSYQEASSLHVEIVDVEDADQREVVRALAGSAACGSDCDCGCGGH